MTDLSFRTIPELGAILRGREASAVDLARHFLERLGSKYNAVVTVLRDRALAEAADRDRESPNTQVAPASAAPRTSPGRPITA